MLSSVSQVPHIRYILVFLKILNRLKIIFEKQNRSNLIPMFNLRKMSSKKASDVFKVTQRFKAEIEMKSDSQAK